MKALDDTYYYGEFHKILNNMLSKSVSIIPICLLEHSTITMGRIYSTVIYDLVNLRQPK